MRARRPLGPGDGIRRAVSLVIVTSREEDPTSRSQSSSGHPSIPARRSGRSDGGGRGLVHSSPNRSTRQEPLPRCDQRKDCKYESFAILFAPTNLKGKVVYSSARHENRNQQAPQLRCCRIGRMADIQSKADREPRLASRSAGDRDRARGKRVPPTNHPAGKTDSYQVALTGAYAEGTEPASLSLASSYEAMPSSHGAPLLGGF